MKKELFVIFVLLITACTSKAIYNIENELIPTNSSGEPPSLEVVEKAILAACRRKGWSSRKVSEGVIEASIYVRSHKATVEITFDENVFNIDYKNSENLDYSNGRIHRNYNKWVIILTRVIQSQLGISTQNY